MSALAIPAFRSLDAVMNNLHKNRASNEKAVDNLLEIYERTKQKCQSIFERQGSKQTNQRHPLIVLEGLDGSGKSTLAREVSVRLNAKQWRTPPNSVKHIRSEFDNNSNLRAAFYGLSNYIAAMEVMLLLEESPVVMDRFWHSTAAFGIAQAIADYPSSYSLPPEGDTFYKWPEDLLQPNIVIFFLVNETERLKRLSRRKESTDQELLLKTSETFRNNITLAYHNMFEPEVIFIDGNQDVPTTLNFTLRKLLPLFPSLS